MDQEFKYSWQETVLDAFMAPPGSLWKTIAVAQTAISERLAALTPTDHEEQIALYDALRALRVLLQETEACTRATPPTKRQDIA